MALAVDGTTNGTGSAVSSITAALTTTQTGDIIIVGVTLEAVSGQAGYTTVSSVTAAGVTSPIGGSGNLQLRNVEQYQHTSGSNEFVDLELWWGYAAATLSAVTITANLTGKVLDDGGLVAFGVSGFTGGTFSTNPWDQSAAIASAWSASSTASSAPTSGTMTTVNANTMLLGYSGSSGGVAQNAVGAFTGTTGTFIANFNNEGGTNSAIGIGGERVVTATQSGTLAFSDSVPGWGILADALSQTGGAVTVAGSTNVLAIPRRVFLRR